MGDAYFPAIYLLLQNDFRGCAGLACIFHEGGWVLVFRLSGRSLNFRREYLLGVDRIEFVLPSTEFAADFDVAAFGQDRLDFFPAKQAKHCGHPVARA